MLLGRVLALLAAHALCSLDLFRSSRKGYTWREVGTVSGRFGTVGVDRLRRLHGGKYRRPSAVNVDECTVWVSSRGAAARCGRSGLTSKLLGRTCVDDAYVDADVTILCGGYDLDVGVVVGNRRTVVHGWIVPLRTAPEQCV